MISVKNLTKYYKNTQALKSISFDINNKEIVGILGPNGAGKSTTLRILTSYLNATNGDVIINGENILFNNREIKKLIGYLPESTPIYNDMCVFDYLVYMADIQEVDRAILRDRLYYVIDACSLREVISKTISELSKGYKQRVGIAGAIIHDPKILILDEPTNGLDPNQILEIRELIRELGKEKTVLISTHILSEVEAICSRVIIIKDGTIVADDTPHNLYNIYSSKNDNLSKVRIKIKTDEKIDSIKLKLKSMKNIESFDVFDSDIDNIKNIILYSKDIIDNIYLFIKDTNWIIYEMIEEKYNLEKAFHNLTTSNREYINE